VDASSSLLGITGQVDVPQESILGPLLFLIYVNDINRALEDLRLNVLFADDTACTVCSADEMSLKKNMLVAFERIETWFNANKLSVNMSLKKNMLVAFESIETWFNANKLSVNMSKTKYMIFSLTGQSLPEFRRLPID